MRFQSIMFTCRQRRLCREVVNSLGLLLFLLLLTHSSLVWAGSYTLSAHGSSSDGVFRPIIGNAPPAGYGYARGNCAHCHEQHASIAGSEPAPVGGPASYTLFTTPFKITTQTHPYTEADNFCFSCHNTTGSVQQVINNNYSQNFGCGSSGPSSILESMNQTSYHNLFDIYTFANNKFGWFLDQSNPCSACHNPHLARRNSAAPQDPAFSAISKPSDHFNLWGTTQTMDTSFNPNYEPPFCANSLTDREPANSANTVVDPAAAKIPDYVAFCTECHNNTDTVYSTTLAANLRPIDWSATGDKHGLRLMDGGLNITSPYTAGGGYVLSCSDCHESHGSSNVMQIRTRVNGANLQGSITKFDSTVNNTVVELSYLCKRCHTDDAAAIGGTADAWEYVHHNPLSSDPPYNQVGPCVSVNCHSSGGSPINCDQCHYHGADIPVTGGSGGNRRAF